MNDKYKYQSQILMEKSHHISWVHLILYRIHFLQCKNDEGGLNIRLGERLYMAEYDDCRRQILTCKDVPRTMRIKIFITALDP